MRPKIETLLYMVLRGTWLVVGICLGAVAVLMINSGAELALDRSLAWGIAIGVGLCILAAFILIMLRPKEMDAPPPLPEATEQEARALMDKLAAKLDLDGSESNQLWEVGKQQAKRVAALGLRLWSGAAALGMAAAVAGSVIAMVTAFAAIRQVSRIDAQNALLEQQIFEAQASRAASVFTAQLPSLLNAIDAERAVATARLTELRNAVAELDQRISEAYLFGFPEDQIQNLQDERTAAEGTLTNLISGYEGEDPDLWVPSDALRARIQAVIDTSEPYVRIPRVDRAVAALNTVTQERNTILQAEAEGPLFQLQWDNLGWREPIPEMRFSPQRGQLLRLLIAAKVDLSRVDPPFDFSHSDLSGFQARTTSDPISDFGFIRMQFGRTNLAYSSFLEADVGGSDISEADLRGSVLSDLQQFQFAKTEFPGLQSDMAFTRQDFFFGTNFVDVLIVDEQFGETLERQGGIGNTITTTDGSQVPISAARELELGLQDQDYSIIGLTGRSLLSQYDISAKAEVDGNAVFRMGKPELLSLVWVLMENSRRNRGVLVAPGFCGGMPEAALSLVQDIVWYSQQPGVHPKWRTVVEIASGKVSPGDVTCFNEFDPAERSAPQIDEETLLKTRQP